MKNIGFAGKMASGKDTMGLYFSNTFRRAKKISFADALRKESQDFVEKVKTENYKPEDMPDDLYETMKDLALRIKSTEERSPEVRKLLQLYGTNYRRKQNPNYWVDKVEERLKNSKDLYYITDARFINELEMLKRNGVYLVRLDVNEKEQRQRIKDRDGIEVKKEDLTHPSETEYLKFKGYDLVIDTNKDDSQETFYKILERYRN